MAITATLVKELRERTGAGMMECKKALSETDGDLEAAVALMRKAGQAKADKKAGRTAAEGIIVIEMAEGNKKAVLLEINSETDFVARDDNFKAFSKEVAETALATGCKDVDSLNEATLLTSAVTVEEGRKNLIAKIGENIKLR